MSHKGTILVVEDTIASLRLLSDILGAEGYQVLPANSGQIALNAAALRSPDLILLDICMPEMDGFEVLRRLKSQEKTRSAAVIILSAETESAQRIEGFRLGAVDFIGKPYQREELLFRVRTHIELCQTRIALEEQAKALKVVNAKLEAEVCQHASVEAALQTQIGIMTALNDKLAQTHNQLLQSEKMAAIGQLAAGVAHELNNPIGFIRSNISSLETYVDNLLAVLQHAEACAATCPDRAKHAAFQRVRKEADIDFLKTDIRELMSESKDGTERVRLIVQNLKDFSHVSEEAWSLADLHKGLDSTLTLVWNEIKYKAEVEKRYGTLPNVNCIAAQINQVFLNILVNAAQAIDTKGKIIISTGCENERVWITISDTGTGIPPANLKRVFEPFFTTKPVGKGTGLGLSLAWSIIEKHHGQLSVESTPGVGTTFRIELPLDGETAPAMQS